jgi:hypothetical protein
MNKKAFTILEGKQRQKVQEYSAIDVLKPPYL